MLNRVADVLIVVCAGYLILRFDPDYINYVDVAAFCTLCVLVYARWMQYKSNALMIRQFKLVLKNPEVVEALYETIQAENQRRKAQQEAKKVPIAALPEKPDSRKS